MQPDAAPLERCASPSRVDVCSMCIPQFVQHTCRASGSWPTPQGAVCGPGRCQGQLLGTIRAAFHHCIFCTQFLEHVLGRWQLADTTLALYADMSPKDAELMVAWLQKHRDSTLKPFTKARAVLSLYGF